MTLKPQYAHRNNKNKKIAAPPKASEDAEKLTTHTLLGACLWKQFASFLKNYTSNCHTIQHLHSWAFFRQMKIYVHTKTHAWMFNSSFNFFIKLFSVCITICDFLLLMKNKGYVSITILMICLPKLKGSHLRVS